MSNDRVEMLPCPFCGGEPNEMRGVFRGDGSVMEWDGETHIYCTSCKASVCVGVGGNVELSHWNTRTPFPQSGEAIAILRKTNNEVRGNLKNLRNAVNGMARERGRNVALFTSYAKKAKGLIADTILATMPKEI